MNHMPGHDAIADAWGRYAALIGAQIGALERGDIDAIEPLARERDTLAWQIEAMGGNTAGRAEARRHVEACLQADSRLRQRLEALQAEVTSSNRRLDHDRAGLRVYTRAAMAGGTVDLSL
jgi:hypothetical protein